MAETYRDTQVTCRDCGKQFILTVEKQRKAAEQGEQVGDLCTACIHRVRYRGKQHGRIKWFSPEKGYGFVTGDGGSEIFVHRDGLLLATGQQQADLEEGSEVLYEVMETSRGPQAFQVELFAA